MFGGGAMLELEREVVVQGVAYRIDGDVALGLREDEVLGTVDAYHVRKGSGGGTFTARR